MARQERITTEDQFLKNLVFIQDSREQRGYEFPGRMVEVAALPVGDYSIKGLHERPEIAIERKSLEDLVISLSSGRQRFERELMKARNLCRHFSIVIESDLNTIAKGEYRSKMQPKAVIQSLICYSVRFDIPVWFCGSREYAERVCQSILEKYAREYYKKFQLLTKG